MDGQGTFLQQTALRTPAPEAAKLKESLNDV